MLSKRRVGRHPPIDDSGLRGSCTPDVKILIRKNDESVHEQHGDFADLTKLDQQI